MHGKHVVLDGQQVVHDREDGLLDLAGVLGAHDQDHALLEVDDHGGLGVGVVHGRVQLQARRRHDHEVGQAVAGKLLLSGADEHLVGKERLAGKLGDDAELAGVAAVGTGDAVDYEEPALGEVRDDLGLDAGVVVLGHGDVDLAPGNLLVDVLGVHDEAVVRGAAGVLARGDRERARAGEGALPPVHGLLDENCGRAVDPGHVVGVRDAVV